MKNRKENTIKLIEACCVLNRLAILIDKLGAYDDERGAEYIKIFADKKIPIERETSGGNIEIAVDDLFNEDYPIISKIAENNIATGYAEGSKIIGVLDFVISSIRGYLLATQDLEESDDYIYNRSEHSKIIEESGISKWDRDPEIIYQELLTLASHVERVGYKI